MPSQLFNNDKISFIAAKNFTYGSHDYEMGDDFPQEEANNIETLVRARYVIPVVDEIDDKPRHWHREVRVRGEAMSHLFRDKTQLVMPDTGGVDLEVLTHPELSPEPETGNEAGVGEAAQEPAMTPGDQTESPAPPAPAEQDPTAVEDLPYDPADHTVNEVNRYLQAASPEERERVMAMEREGRGRNGIET